MPTNGTVHVHFLKVAPPASVQRDVIACEAGDDRFAFAGRELYWWCPSKMMDSPVDMKAVGKLLGPLDHEPQHHDGAPPGGEVPAGVNPETAPAASGVTGCPFIDAAAPTGWAPPPTRHLDTHLSSGEHRV